MKTIIQLLWSALKDSDSGVQWAVGPTGLPCVLLEDLSAFAALYTGRGTTVGKNVEANWCRCFRSYGFRKLHSPKGTQMWHHPQFLPGCDPNAIKRRLRGSRACMERAMPPVVHMVDQMESPSTASKAAKTRSTSIVACARPSLFHRHEGDDIRPVLQQSQQQSQSRTLHEQEQQSLQESVNGDREAIMNPSGVRVHDHSAVAPPSQPLPDTDDESDCNRNRCDDDWGSEHSGEDEINNSTVSRLRLTCCSDDQFDSSSMEECLTIQGYDYSMPDIPMSAVTLSTDLYGAESFDV